MKVAAAQLQQDLKKQIRPVYLVSGDDPLLMQEACDAIRAACRQADFQERATYQADRTFNWQTLADEAGAMSLFGEKKIIEITLPSGKPGDPGAKAIEQFCQTVSDEYVLILICGKIDSNTLKRKWVSAIDKAGAIIQIWPIELPQFPGWLKQRLQNAGFTADNDALSLLCDKTEGNLLAAQQEIEKLRLTQSDSHLTAENISNTVGDSARYSIFDLTDACLAQDLPHALKICQGLKDEGTDKTLIIWSLSREIRLLYAVAAGLHQNTPPAQIFKQQRLFLQKKQKQLLSAAPRFNLSKLNQLITLTHNADKAGKGIDRANDPWLLIRDIILLICGQPLFTP